MNTTRTKLKLLALLTSCAACAAGAWFWFRESPAEVFSRGLAAVEKQDLEEVSRAASVLERYPEFQQHASLLRGCVLLNEGKVQRALREFSGTKPEGAIRFPALLYAGQALYRIGNLTDAGQVIATLVSEDPGNAEAHRWLGAVYYDMGMQSAAMSELTEVTRLNPLDYRPHRLLGSMCTDQSLFAKAIEHYRTALKLGKNIPQPDIEVDLAALLVGRNEFEEALDSLRNSKATSTVWALRADCYDGLGQPDKSRDAVAKAMLANSQDPRALLLFGTQQLFDGNPQGAIEPLTELLKQDPHHSAARYQLAMAYLKLGQTEAWQREMEKRDASNKLHERFSAAVLLAGKEPENVEVRQELASIAESLGQTEIAKRWEMAAIACRNAVEQEKNTNP